MKKFLLITILAACVCAFTACNSNVSTDKLLYCNWPENGKETFTYQIKKGDAVVGQLVQSIENIAEGFKLSVNQTMSNGDTVTGYVTFANLSGYYPLESVRTFTKSNGEVTTQKVVYSGGKASYFTAEAAAIPDETEGQSTSISAPYYDNLQFYTIIRGAAYNNKFNFSFSLFIPNETKVAKIACSLSGTETLSYFITVDGEAQEVSCQLINVIRSQKISGVPNKAYYATSDISVGDKKVKQALVKFIEGEYSYNLVAISAE